MMNNNAKRKEVILGEGGQVDSFLGHKDMTVNQELDGIYRGSFTVVGKYGPQLVHKLETKDGTFGINGCGQLNKKLAKITEGTAVTIVYGGTEKIKKGDWKGTEAIQFKVFADVADDGVDSSDENDL
jgi:hypothetical protein